MSDPGPRQFDEPVLKDAIRRVRGGHRASPDLRLRIVQAIAKERLALVPAAASLAAKAPRRLVIRPWLAIAASLLLLVAAGVFVYVKYFTLTPGKDHGGYFDERNEKILSAMVAAQTRGISSTPGAKPINAPLGDPSVLAKAIAAESGREVPVADFSDQGWKPISAAICPIGGVQGVQIDYARGNDRLSVLALPAIAFVNAREGNEYQYFVEKHPLAGFVHNGTIICVVADPKIRGDYAAKLRDRLKAQKTM